MATAYSSLHTQRPPRRPTQKARPAPPLAGPIPLPAPSTTGSTTSLGMTDLASRTSSLAGRKRPRESDDGKLKPRRTKSSGDPGGAGAGASREAFQRGLIAVFVPNALRDSARGSMGGYNELLAYFLPSTLQPTPSLPLLLPLVRVLAANVSLLNPALHGALVSAILALPWATDDRFTKVFIGWAGVLVSAHQGWTREVATMAVRGLTWQHASGLSTPRKVFHARNHLLLSHLISLIPTLPNTLGPLVLRHFPHKREREVVQTTYLRNACAMIDYCPELGTRIWSEIIDRMLRIDVEITKADDDDEDEERLLELMEMSNIGTDADPFDMTLAEDVPPDPIVRDDSETEEQDDVDDLSSNEGSVSDEEEEDEMKEAIARARKKLSALLMRRKLDGMMFWFNRHLGEAMGAPHSPPAAQLGSASVSVSVSVSASGSSTPDIAPIKTSPIDSLAAFQTLLNLFSRQVLQTTATQHIPFLLFIAASHSPAHTDLFLGLLVSLSLYGQSATSAAAPPATRLQRIAATVYIGSVVCRARFVSDDQARQVIKYLLAYIDGRLHEAKAQAGSGGQQAARMEDMPLLYAVCQAVMLIFCFRWRAFVNEDEIELEDVPNSRWMAELEVLQQAITSDLNPLLGCNPTIVHTFANVAHQTDFAYCFSIIESNAAASRSSLALSRPASGSGSGHPRPALSARSSTRGGAYTLALPREARRANIDAGLDGYFPFDPYDLPRSGEAVEPLYRTWGEVGDEEDSDGEDEEDDEEDDEIGQVDGEGEGESTEASSMGGSSLGMALSPRMIFEKRKGLKEGFLSSSFEGMSISPGLAAYS